MGPSIFSFDIKVYLMKKMSLVIFSFLFSVLASGEKLSFENYSLIKNLKNESRYLRKLKDSGVEVLIPVKVQGQRTLSVDLSQDSAAEIDLKIQEVAKGRWNPIVRIDLLRQQVEFCRQNGTFQCELYDTLLPMTAVAFEDRGQIYFFIRADVTQGVLEQRNSQGVVSFGEKQKGHKVPVALYSSQDDRLLSLNLIYSGSYSTLFRPVEGEAFLVDYSVFSTGAQQEKESDFYKPISVGVCQRSLSPPSSPAVTGVVCQKEETLYVDGLLDSYTLQQIKFSLPQIRKIQWNSAGGNYSGQAKRLADEIAQKVRSLKITSEVRKGAHCGSLCTLLFQAGFKRQAHESAIFLFHGPHWRQEAMDYRSMCLNSESTKECVSKRQSYLKIKDDFFNQLEKFDLSPQLDERLMSQPDDSNWFRSGNLIRKRDLILSAREVLPYQVIHQVLEDK